MPFTSGIGVTELIIVLVIVLIIFGPKRLPSMGRSLGSGMREFKDSISGKHQDEDDDRPEIAEAKADAVESKGESDQAKAERLRAEADALEPDGRRQAAGAEVLEPDAQRPRAEQGTS